MELKENERIDDLQCHGRMLIQNKSMFCFGIDAVLLANYAVVNEGDVCMDLCTGNGIIPVLMEAKTKGKHYTGLEIQKESAELARFDVVTVNPPYMNENHGIVNPSSPKAIARHEICCTLEDIISTSSALLRDKGRFYMVHRPQRLVQIFELCHSYRLEPKRMRMVYPSYGKNANMVLIEAVRGGNSQLTTEPPLIVYNEDGGYTEDVLRYYRDGGEDER